jgi:hypothetical protein
MAVSRQTGCGRALKFRCNAPLVAAALSGVFALVKATNRFAPAIRKMSTSPRARAIALAACSAVMVSAQPAQCGTGTFAQVNALPAGFKNPSFMFLLTDGTVMVQDQFGTAQNWWRLTPDNTGSYANGSWTQLQSLAAIPQTANYGPRFYAGAVLPDGRVAIEGGEYNLGVFPPPGQNPADSPLGAIYNPQRNFWDPVRPPPGWTNIGDASAAVLPTDQWLLADGLTSQMVLFNANSLTWTPTGFNFRACTNNEAGWTLLADGSMFSVDNNIRQGCPTTQDGERWVPTNGITPIGTWHIADNGTGTQQLFDICQEMGPQVLLPNNNVLTIGANGKVSIYTPPPVATPPSTAAGSWANTTPLPATCGTAGNVQCGANDAPASLLPNGNVLVFAGAANISNSSACTAAQEFAVGSHFFEFDSSSNWTQVPALPAALATAVGADAAYNGMLIVLPNGHALFTLGTDLATSTVWDYTPDQTIPPHPAWVPKIVTFPSTITRGLTYALHGKLINGVSQANFYGDDAQNATNYPIVQVTINANGHKYYGRTHDHSSMGVNLVGEKISTRFELLTCPQPLGASCVPETGAATLRVIANGIASAPESITIN